jgi:hypothetical protein
MKEPIHLTPPAHAEYLEGVRVEPDHDHPFSRVQVYWYPEGRIRIQIKGAAPAVLNGAYLEGTGEDVNLKLAKPYAERASR